MKKVIKKMWKFNKTETKSIILSFIIMFFIFSPFLIEHYTTDSYNWQISNHAYNPIFSQTGRQFSDFILAFSSRMGFGPIEYQFVHNFLAIIILSISAIILYKSIKIVKKNIEFKEELFIIGSFISVFCLYLAELFIFNCMLSISLSILFVMISIYVLSKGLTYKNIITALILNFFVITTYQTVIALYIAFAILIIGYQHKEKSIKEFLLIILKLISIFCISFIFDIILLKSFYAVKTIQITSLNEKILNLISSQQLIFIDTYGIFPKNSFMFFIIVFLILSIYVIIKNKEKIKRSILIMFLSIMSLLGGSYLVIFSGSGIMSRIIFPVSAIIGLLILIIGLFEEKIPEKNKINPIYLSKVILVFFFFIFINSNSNLMFEVTEYNKLNDHEAKQILNIMQKYEEKQNINITQIRFGQDPIVGWYPTNYSLPDVFLRALYVGWSRGPILEIHSNRKFNSETMDNDTNKKYCSENFDSFDEKQVNFDKNIMYICSY